MYVKRSPCIKESHRKSASIKTAFEVIESVGEIETSSHRSNLLRIDAE